MSFVLRASPGRRIIQRWGGRTWEVEGLTDFPRGANDPERPRHELHQSVYHHRNRCSNWRHLNLTIKQQEIRQILGFSLRDACSLWLFMPKCLNFTLKKVEKKEEEKTTEMWFQVNKSWQWWTMLLNWEIAMILYNWISSNEKKK